MRNRIADVLWLVGAALCRLASRVETRPVPDMTAAITAAAAAIDAPHTDRQQRHGAGIVVPTSSGPLFIPSVDGRTIPWQATGSSQRQ